MMTIDSCCSKNVTARLPVPTFQQYDGEVLGSLALACGKALVGSRVSLLRSRNEQCLIVGSLDGKMLIGQDRFCVTVPRHSKVGGALHGTGEDDCTADPGL